MKHYIIAAKLGYDPSLKSFGLMSKEDFAAALRDHKAAIEAAKSPQRGAAAGEVCLHEAPGEGVHG